MSNHDPYSDPSGPLVVDMPKFTQLGGADAFHEINFEVNNLKLFPYLAFPHLINLETARKCPSFDGKLMASCETGAYAP